jgi:hypothetical protein
MAPNRIGRADGMSDLYLRLQTWLDDALNFWSDNGVDRLHVASPLSLTP